MRLRVREALGAAVVTVVALAAAAIALVSLWGCSSGATEAAAWPESAEFSTLETGQGRFSAYDTNLDGWRILVDRQTGVQYIVGNTVHTVCPLLDADGTPLLVAEAGE